MIGRFSSVVLVAALSLCNGFASSQVGACLNNLRQIDAAKEQCRIERGLKLGDPVEVGWLTNYLRDYDLHCPAGGTYTIGPIGTYPRCSIELHSEAGLQRYLTSWKNQRVLLSVGAMTAIGGGCLVFLSGAKRARVRKNLAPVGLKFYLGLFGIAYVVSGVLLCFIWTNGQVDAPLWLRIFFFPFGLKAARWL